MQPCSPCTCRTSCSLLSPYWTKSGPPQCQTSASQNVPTCHLNMTHDSRVTMSVCKLCRATCFFTKELVHSIAFQWVCFPTSTCSMKSLAESAVRWEEGTMSWTPASANTRHGHPDKTLMFCYVMLVSWLFNGGNGLQQRSAPKIVHVEFLGQNKFIVSDPDKYHVLPHQQIKSKIPQFRSSKPFALVSYTDLWRRCNQSLEVLEWHCHSPVDCGHVCFTIPWVLLQVIAFHKQINHRRCVCINSLRVSQSFF